VERIRKNEARPVARENLKHQFAVKKPWIRTPDKPDQLDLIG